MRPNSTSCVHTPMDGSCNDGSLCTFDDLSDGSCQGTPLPCDDSDPCTSDSCNEGTGDCVSVIEEGVPCDDDDPCTLADVCVMEGCRGTPLNCDDGDGCNGVELCAEGECIAANIPACGDGEVASEWQKTATTLTLGWRLLLIFM